MNILETMQNRITTKSTYFAIPTIKSPIDFWLYQEIIYTTKPDVIIEIGNYMGGSTLALAHICDNLNHGRVIGIDINQSRLYSKARNHPRITWIKGDAVKVLPKVQIDQAETVMVIEDSSHTFSNTLAVLEAYSPLIKPGYYFIVEDTICHHGLNVGPFPGPYEAVESFLRNHDDFVVDISMEDFGITWNPRGYLRKVSK